MSRPCFRDRLIETGEVLPVGGWVEVKAASNTNDRRTSRAAAHVIKELQARLGGVHHLAECIEGTGCHWSLIFSEGMMTVDAQFLAGRK